MAATQAEKQQNDVNSEKVQPDQHLNVRNSLLQNGTDKSGVRGGGSVVVTKGKATGTMSQYRQDGANEQGMNEPDLGPTGSEAGLYPPAPAASSEGPPVGDGHGYGFPFGGRDMHNSSDGSLHGFASRQGFGGPKQPYQQRFVSGQTISQPTGPTPTLNQLLQQSSLQQSSNPMHRYQNNYGHPEQPYGQGWPPQKPLAPYSTAAGSAPGGTVYRNQSALSPAYSGAPAASPGYGEGRAGWPGPPVSGQHGPSSPGPPSATTIASQPSPQPTQQPSHSPGPGLPPSPQHPTTQPQHQNFPNRPAQPTTPNAHAPDSSVTLECYPPRPQSNIQYPNQGYGPPVSQTPLNSNIQPQQFPNRSTPNHMSNSQFPAYQQSWTGPITSSGNHLPGGKGNGPPQAPNSPSPCPPRPPHYLKQHLQHKMGFGNVPSSMPPSPSPPQNYHMGPPSASHHHSGMGPPPSMGPPNMPTATSPLLPNSHSHDGPMPPPSSTPNSHHQLGPDMMDNGITTTATGTLTTHVTAASGGSVTSVVTTGPDGAPIDEGSQQSTLSNTSAASGEDPQCTTPKSSRKNDMGHYSHPTTPQSTVPSPGAASMNSMHEEYGDLNSPSWPRTPASPKTDSLGKLYEMDDNPDRRAWLDKLLAYMEERRTPILACPTISKNPLDLFRLYVFVKERGGFLEVSKNKTWKDIAGLLGIGASSSAAYTLRKHYTKNLLAYECQFDRGGIDPQPIINQIEASSKKKGAKSASVPSPGSSNSQDSFPAPGSGGASMDGYGGYGYPPSNNPDFNAPSQRPSSQANAPSPHAGSAGANHLGNAPARGPSPATGGSDNVNISNPFEDVSPSPPPRGGGGSGGGPFPGPHPPYPSVAPPRPQGQNYNNQVGYNQYPGPGPGAPPEQYSPYPAGTNYPPTSRTVYSPYSGDSPAPPSTSNNSQGGAPPAGQDPYNRYTMNTATGPAGYSPRPTYTGTPVAASGPVPGPGPGPGPGPTTQPPPGPYPAQEYYRPDQNYTNQQGAPQTPATYPGGPPANKNMPPPAPQQPRRHPDFANKEQQQQAYPVQYGQRPQMYGGWPNNTQYRGQYGPTTGPTGGPGGTGTQQWNQGGRPSGQWERYPSGTQGFQPPQQGQQQWSPMPTPGVGQSSPLRPPMGPRSGKPFAMLPPQSGKPTPSQVPGGSSLTQSQLPKREITFPSDSVEATLPVLYRRKRMCRSDLGPVDAWRIIMSLKSGLLTESCFALDVLNVLLFDDSSVAYFGLNQWPGLLELLLEHFRKSLSDMFHGKSKKDKPTAELEVDLGGVSSPIDPESRTVFLRNTTNYTNVSRKGFPVRMIDRSDDILVKDHQKAWDVRGDSNRASIILADVVMDPWHHTVDHILPTFQAEFGHIPFCRTLEKEDKEIKLEKVALEKEPEPHRTPSPDVPPPASKPSDKKRRTKTLSDVISRIKKETIDDNGVLALEIKEKIKTEVVSETENCKEEEQPSTDLTAAVNAELNNELTVRDPACTLKRRRISDYEDEAYTRDDASLILLTESQDNIGKRCVCISNILRSLTFIPGNETEFANSPAFLSLVGKLLLLYHDHPIRTQKTRNYDREEDADFADSCSSLQGESEWWWEFLLQIRENMLVSTSNIAGYIDLDQYDEEVSRPLLDGLLHWAICPSAYGQDSFASVGPSSLLSPQRLALEALCKLCVTNGNVDLVIATPPFSRLERLCAVLTKHLCRSEDQVLREFSINLLHYLAAADSSMSRVIALQLPCISLLVAFIEQAEQSALGVANQHGIGALRENPDSMGTSLDMLRRAAATLVFLAQHPENKPLLVQQEPRLLALVMSQILDQQVALLLSKVLFQISRS